MSSALVNPTSIDCQLRGDPDDKDIFQHVTVKMFAMYIKPLYPAACDPAQLCNKRGGCQVQLNFTVDGDFIKLFGLERQDEATVGCT